MGNDLMREYQVLVDCGRGKLIWPQPDGRKTQIGTLAHHLGTIKVATAIAHKWDKWENGFEAICASIPEAWAKTKLDTGLTRTDPIKGARTGAQTAPAVPY